MIPLSGFSLSEVGAPAQNRHWLRGAFPRAYLARSNAESLSWRRQFIHTFLERDLPQLGIGVPATALLRFWTMVAHSHGNVWNAADPARSLGVSEPTVRRYLDLLSGLFMVRRPAMARNLKKRCEVAQGLRDSGLLHCLLGIGAERICHASEMRRTIDEDAQDGAPDGVLLIRPSGPVAHKDGRRLGKSNAWMRRC
jgi:hypothetical protein